MRFTDSIAVIVIFSFFLTHSYSAIEEEQKKTPARLKVETHLRVVESNLKTVQSNLRAVGENLAVIEFEMRELKSLKNQFETLGKSYREYFSSIDRVASGDHQAERMEQRAQVTKLAIEVSNALNSIHGRLEPLESEHSIWSNKKKAYEAFLSALNRKKTDDEYYLRSHKN